MKKSLIFSLFLLWSLPSLAEEVVAPDANVEKTTAEDVNVPAEEAVQPVVYKVEKKILPLPECDDAQLLNKTKEFITSYYANNTNQGILFRRRRHFLLNNLNKFSKENIANYKTEAARPVSDAIIDLQMNHNILEENMRLCKKQAETKIANDIYLLVYPFEQGYKVHVLNLDKNRPNDKNIFTY